MATAEKLLETEAIRNIVLLSMS